MKKINFVIVTTLASVLTFAGIAFAKTDMMMGASNTNMMKPSSMMMHSPKPMIITISNGGYGTIRGKVETVASNKLTITSWGGAWTVNTTSDTSAIMVGDFVGVSGMISTDSPTITADYVRDWTDKSMMKKSDMMKDTSGTMNSESSMTSSTTNGSMMH